MRFFITTISLLLTLNSCLFASNPYEDAGQKLQFQFSSSVNPFRMRNSVETLIEMSEKLDSCNYQVPSVACSIHKSRHKEGLDTLYLPLCGLRETLGFAKGFLWQQDMHLIADLIYLFSFLDRANERGSSGIKGVLFPTEGVDAIASARSDVLVQLKDVVASSREKQCPITKFGDDYRRLEDIVDLARHKCHTSAASGAKQWFLYKAQKDFYSFVTEAPWTLLQRCFSDTRVPKSLLPIPQRLNISEEFVVSQMRGIATIVDGCFKDIGQKNTWELFDVFYFSSSRAGNEKNMAFSEEDLSDVGHLFTRLMVSNFEKIKLRDDAALFRSRALFKLQALEHFIDHLVPDTKWGVLHITSAKALCELGAHFGWHVVQEVATKGLTYALASGSAVLGHCALGTVCLPVLGTILLAEGVMMYYEFNKVTQKAELKRIKLCDEHVRLATICAEFLSARKYEFTAADKVAVRFTALRALEKGYTGEEIQESAGHHPYILDLISKISKASNFVL